VHLLLTDVVLPKLGGRELAERVSSRRPGIKVLFISGYTDDVTMHNGLLEPGAALLQKPFTAESVGRRVREALDGLRSGA
jgi:FixJ family two-component response regulator